MSVEDKFEDELKGNFSGIDFGGYDLFALVS
jgi:hypothetical protein